MSLAWLSVGALLVAVTLSCTTTINVGILSMALALAVGVFLGGMTPAAVLRGFPVDLLVTLVGVTLLFAIAEVNGTLERLTARAVRACRGHAGALPVMFFVIAFAVSTIGAGATPASALLAPPAMAVAARAGVPPLLMVLMTGNGALAGTLSPFAPTGIVAHGVMARIGLGGVVFSTFAYNALAHAFVGIAGFLVLGGWRLFRRDAARAAADERTLPFERAHWLTAAGITALIVAVGGFGLDTGMMALLVAATLILLRAADEARAIQRMPWGVMLMVTGVTVLIALMQASQGLDLITSAIAAVSTPATIAPVAAFGSGIVSVYSSTSGVVLPAFLPMAPDLAQRLGGVDPLAIAWSINVGASLVDLSSLSTVGALFIAGAPPGTDTRALFNGLLAWGLTMAVVGAALCWMAFG
jgi:di/tricarboxylate transporter